MLRPHSNSENRCGADPGVEDKATYGIRRLWKSLRFHWSGYALEDLEALYDPAKDCENDPDLLRGLPSKRFAGALPSEGRSIRDACLAPFSCLWHVTLDWVARRAFGDNKTGIQFNLSQKLLKVFLDLDFDLL